MRAVVLTADGQPTLAETAVPAGPGYLVRVHACGLCGSDVEKLGRPPPVGAVLGHELAGRLEDGTRVTVMHRVPCGECDRCRAGHESTCEEFRVPRLQPGGFAELARATDVVPLPDELTDIDGVWVEPLACVLRAAELVPHGRVLVVGCGAMGLLWTQVLVRRGDSVCASDPRRERVLRAVELGATQERGAVEAAVLTAHGGVGDALTSLVPGGTLLVFAAAAGPVALDLAAVYRNELRLVGSRSATPRFFGRALELLPSLDLPATTVLPLERFADGVDLYRRGEALKIVFMP